MFSHTFKFVFIIACICPLNASVATEQSKADSLFSVASETLNDGHLQNSIKAFKRVLQADDHYAPAHEQIARLHLQEDTPDSRRLAEFAARQAINHDPNNPMYQLLLGDVMLFRGFRHNAGKHYDEILAKFPNSAEVALNAGRNALIEFMMTKDRGVIMGRGATQEFTEKTWDRATLLLDKSLTLDPTTNDHPSSGRSVPATILRLLLRDRVV